MTDKSETDSSTTENAHTHPHHNAHKHDSKCKNKSKWSVNKLFWGLLLILVGGLMLASNFGLVDVKWGNIWRLWPLIIISTGLSIMSFKNIFWRILMVVLVMATLGAITWVVIGDTSNLSPIHSQEMSVDKITNDVEQAEVSIKAGASALKINTTDQKEIVKVKLDSNVTTLAKTSTLNSRSQQIDFYMSNNSNWWVGDIRNVWDVKLSQGLPITLNVDAGASDTQIDTSNAKLREMNIKAGASNLNIKLGKIENVSNINIDSGASSVVLKIPSGVGVRLSLEGGLTTKYLSDLNKTTDNVFESPDFSKSKQQINIVAKIGVSSFTVERY